MWSKKTPEESNLEMLDPRHVPSGGRRMSAMPLAVFMLLLAGCIIVGGYVLYDRSKQTAERVQQEQKASVNASNFATELAGSAPQSGVVPATTKTPQVPQLPELPSDPVKEESSSPAKPTLPSTAPTVALNPWGEHSSRLSDTRFTALESALKSRTGVMLGGTSAASQLAAVQAEQARTQTRLTNARQQTADPTAAYQSRLEALRGTLGDGASSSSRGQLRGDGGQGELMQYARNAWALPGEVETPASPYTLQAGFIIPAIMISGISSNLPGQVMAQVSQNVFDSPTGNHVLIPQGTRLVGTYNSDIGYGQERVLMAWQRLLFPDGRTLDIQAMPGADAGGKAGFTDKVNSHFWRTFSSAFLLSGIVAAVSLSQGDRMATGSSDRQRASDAMSEALGQNLGTAMAETIRKNLNIAPTLEIRPGYRFNVMVTKDMAFPGPYTK